MGIKAFKIIIKQRLEFGQVFLNLSGFCPMALPHPLPGHPPPPPPAGGRAREPWQGEAARQGDPGTAAGPDLAEEGGGAQHPGQQQEEGS